MQEKDKAVLELIQAYLGVGTVTKHGKDSMFYVVRSREVLTNVIIPHFVKYPLLTQKRADFELFKLVVELMNKKEHLTKEGLNKIVAIKASMNKGLSDELKAAFPNIGPVQRPLVLLSESIDPY